MNDSDLYVQDVLADGFRLQEKQLSTDDMLAFLCQAIKDLPATDVKVVSFIGGAASGKSTVSKMLAEKLVAMGVAADKIGTDDFNKGNREWRWANFEGENPKDPVGKYDFDLLNQKVAAIKANHDPNKTIAVPTYSQATGLAIDAGEENYTHHVGPLEVLIIEGDFHPVERPDLTIFLHVPDEQRLRNRIDRDVVHRGGDEVKTTNSFNFRQQNQHFPYTLPVVKRADMVLDGSGSGTNWHYDVYRSTK